MKAVPCAVCGLGPGTASLRVNGVQRGVCAACEPAQRALNQERIRQNGQRWGATFTFKMRGIAS